MANKQAVAYLRVSGLGQVDGDGFARQAAAVARYARAAGFSIVDTYRDEGVPGKTEMADRPGLAALLDRIDSDGVRVVLIERADRLARDLIASETILGQFRSRDVKVFDAESVELTRGDGNNPTQKLIRQVLAAVSEFDRDVIVLKLRAARERIRRREGRCEGPKPFGSVPAEKAVLERILALRRGNRAHGRMSFARIAATLNAEGVPTRSGTKWAPAVVFGIVRREQPRLTAAK